MFAVVHVLVSEYQGRTQVLTVNIEKSQDSAGKLRSAMVDRVIKESNAFIEAEAQKQNRKPYFSEKWEVCKDKPSGNAVVVWKSGCKGNQHLFHIEEVFV